MSRIYAATFGLAVIAVAVLANIPGLALPGKLDDKLLHFVAFSVLAVLAAGARPHKSVFDVGIWLAAFAGAIELIQHFMYLGREADWLDFGAGVAGAVAALIVVSISRLVSSKRAQN